MPMAAQRVPQHPIQAGQMLLQRRLSPRGSSAIAGRGTRRLYETGEQDDGDESVGVDACIEGASRGYSACAMLYQSLMIYSRGGKEQFLNL